MSALFALVVPFAGCAAMMLLCTRMMRRGGCATDPSQPTEVAQLRAEVAELRAQLEPAAQPDRASRPVR